MKNVIILFSLSGFLISCTTTSYISPKKDLSNAVSKFLNEGKEIGVSVKGSSTVVFSGFRENRELTVRIFYKNESDQHINIYPESLAVYGVEKDGGFEKLDTYNPQSYLKRMRNRQNLALALSAMSKAYEDADAGTTTTTEYGSGNGYDGYAYYYETTTKTDESKKRAAQRENQQEIQRLAMQADLYRNSVKNGLLMKTTLFPDSHIEGNVMVKFKPFDQYLLRVSIGKDIHEIYFNLVEF